MTLVNYNLLYFNNYLICLYLLKKNNYNSYYLLKKIKYDIKSTRFKNINILYFLNLNYILKKQHRSYRHYLFFKRILFFKYDLKHIYSFLKFEKKFIKNLKKIYEKTKDIVTPSKRSKWYFEFTNKYLSKNSNNNYIYYNYYLYYKDLKKYKKTIERQYYKKKRNNYYTALFKYLNG